MIQPDIDIDEATTAGFLSQAQKELDPYYTQIISLAKEDLSREFGEVKRQYGEGIEDIGEAAAERGLAFSGIRKKQETELAGSATRLAGGLGRSTERQIGSASLAGFTAPTIGTTPLYTLSGDITGELERERTVAESTRQSELEGLYRSQRALDFQT